MTPDGELNNRYIDIRYTKWPSQPHYAYRMRLLGEDDYGVWGSCDTGEEVYKAGELGFVRNTSLLSLVTRVGCWSALWYPPQEAQYELYVDINTNPVWGPTVSHSIGGTPPRLVWTLDVLYQLIHRKIARRASARVAKRRPRMHSRLRLAQNQGGGRRRAGFGEVTLRLS